MIFGAVNIKKLGAWGVRKALVFGLAACLTLSNGLINVSAGSDKDEKAAALEEQITESQTELDEANSRLERTRNERGGLMAEIQAKEEEVNGLNAELAEIEEDLVRINQDLEEAESELDAANEALSEQFEILKVRLRALEESGQMGYLETLLGSADFADFLNRLEAVESIAKYDKDMFDSLAAAEKAVNDVYTRINNSKNELEQTKETRVGKIADLNGFIDEKNDLYNELALDEEAAAQFIAEEEALQEDLVRELKLLTARNAGERIYAGGKFQMPITNYRQVSSGYGGRSDPFTRGGSFHTGIDYAASYGTSIYAAEAGVVVKASWYSGYGNCVIIDHGSGFSTLYGHASSLTVSVGDVVEAGDVVAKVGSTGRSTGNHLHFEVRINGEDTSPLGYLG